MSDKLTIQKLAKELSLSRSTVHRALTNHQNVHPETRRKVLQAAQKKGYMRHGGKRDIAILVPCFSFFGYLGEILMCLEEEFDRRGCMIELIPINNIELLGNYMFDGVVSLVWRKGMEKILPQKFAVPIITVNTSSNMLESVPAIMSDPHGIRMALDYLHNRGCRKIFFVAGLTENIPDAALRLEEFRSFCLETGQDFESLHQESRRPEELVSVILKAKADACFCAGENYAARLGFKLKKEGIRIPEDISLMGLETLYLNEFFTPPITAIRQDFEQLASVAAEMMYQAIVNKIPPTCVTIPFQLIERESVRQPQ